MTEGREDVDDVRCLPLGGERQVEDVRSIRDNVLGGEVHVGDIGLHEVELVVEWLQYGIVREDTTAGTRLLLGSTDQLAKPGTVITSVISCVQCEDIQTYWT